MSYPFHFGKTFSKFFSLHQQSSPSLIPFPFPYHPDLVLAAIQQCFLGPVVGVHLSFSPFSPFIVEIYTAPVDNGVHLPLSKVAEATVIFEVQRSSKSKARKEEQCKQELEVGFSRTRSTG
ncbi:hypothetical protein ES319_D05G329700v1 [Gossypium barbadense]|uniref:Uncharacterized protein n=2 Tax=Gossypium TaxID=3633 RepID=A0A5J5RST7_GOSBA|nr:hypothetical protein ES319_D05G329700v1 [Gossypium barbadense]TYG70872.1 hypothetical protein ES288_D05G349200v1 [Gossypium darwinii]